MKSKREKALEYFTKKGYVKVKSKSCRYLTLEKPRESRKIFLGKSGAIRVGETVSTSSSMTHLFKFN